ncbi:MAG: FG-GAP repeat protein [Pseudomonadales bacterium]
MDGTNLLQKTAETAKAQFGKAVAVGDVNGDGYADVLVGAPLDDNTDAALKDTGSITVFSGSNGEKLTKKYGAAAKANLGNSVAAGDVDGDSKADIIAGAWKDDKASSNPKKPIKDAGSVSIFSGNGYAPITVLYGTAAKDFYGFAVSAGDINSDGNADLIIGVPGFDAPGVKPIKDAGKVTVLSGASL